LEKKDKNLETDNINKELDRINDLPTLPAIALEVNKMLQDYDTTRLEILRDRIEKDQAITAKILKLANSAFFGVRSKVTSITHAITLLGFNTIRNAIVSVSIMDALSVNGDAARFDIKGFWKHSVAAAVMSRYIAEQTKLYSPDDCFIGGLLHDIGKVVMLKHFPDIFFSIHTSCIKNEKSFFNIEKEKGSVNHSYIGYYLAKKWQLPMKLADVIRYHHTFSSSAREYKFLAIVGLADVILNTSNPADSKISIPDVSPEIKKAVYDILDTLPVWFPVLSENIESACSFFMTELKQ
jgi:putative nucleotidyltransferase with HDIG domain